MGSIHATRETCYLLSVRHMQYASPVTSREISPIEKITLGLMPTSAYAHTQRLFNIHTLYNYPIWKISNHPSNCNYGTTKMKCLITAFPIRGNMVAPLCELLVTYISGSSIALLNNPDDLTSLWSLVSCVWTAMEIQCRTVRITRLQANLLKQRLTTRDHSHVSTTCI